VVPPWPTLDVPPVPPDAPAVPEPSPDPAPHPDIAQPTSKASPPAMVRKRNFGDLTDGANLDMACLSLLPDICVHWRAVTMVVTETPLRIA
jgi:hypothetical protein